MRAARTPFPRSQAANLRPPVRATDRLTPGTVTAGSQKPSLCSLHLARLRHSNPPPLSHRPPRPAPLASTPHTDSLHLLASMALGANSVSISALRQSTHDELSVDEEEVDQLDSGLDSEEEVDELDEAAPAASASVSASVSKPRPKKTGDRVPGHTLLPATRVENILQGSGAL